jgi:hypothetical protein
LEDPPYKCSISHAHNYITMNIYKLTYPNKEAAIADLKAKGILIEVDGIDGQKHEAYGNGVQAVVEIGLIMLTPPVMEGMEVIEEPIYAEGYHYDVMSSELYEFGSNLVEPKNPKHAFAGHAVTEEFPYEPQFLGDEA